MPKVKLIRNWYNEVTRVLEPAGTELDITEKGGEGAMPKATHDKYVKIEKESGVEFIPYFAGTPETAEWLKKREARFAAVKAENERRAAVQAKKV
jgi:hypothetical protein